MYISKEVARDIIKEIRPFINFNINIMDGTGLIIASTNENRENTHHEGAKRLINEHLDSLIVEEDNLYEGCMKGINLPIYFANQVVGVIGITGEPAETIKYGQILQKMTEMLIYENFNSIQRINKENSNLLLVNDIIHGNFQDTMFTMEERLVQSGLAPKGHFTVALFRVYESPENSVDVELKLARANILKNYITSYLTPKHILCAYNGEFYIAITNLTLENFSNLLSSLKLSLENAYGVSIICSIGNEYNEYLDVPKSYNEALIVSHHFELKETGIFIFTTIVLNFIINQIPTTHKKNLFFQVFKNCDKKEILEFCPFIISYFQCNGSLNKLAEENYIHKNTVQYKIIKILKKTELDMRVYNDLFILYLAATCN